MLVEKFSGSGSTDFRRAFWDNIADAVESVRKLSGKNVVVTEFDSGSLIDVTPQAPGAAPPGGCFLSTGDVITCIFSGITIDGTCQTYGLGNGSFTDTASMVDLNTTYNSAFVDTVDCFNVDPCPCDAAANLYNSDVLTGAYHQQQWNDPNITCAGAPDGEADFDVLASVYCDCTGLTVVLAGSEIFFIATGITTPGTYSNEGTFNSTVHQPYFSDTLVAAHGGTVAISW